MMSKRITAIPRRNGMCKVITHQQWAPLRRSENAASEKLRISLSRTRSTIEQILYSNEFSLFITLTIQNDTQGNPPTREDVEAHIKKENARTPESKQSTCSLSACTGIV